MEGVGLGLGVLAEVRTNVKSIQDRIRCYKEGPALFEKVDTVTIRITSFANKIADILDTTPVVIPNDVLLLFIESIGFVTASLQRADNTLQLLRGHEVAGSSSGGAVEALANKGKRFFSAKSYYKMLNDVEKEVNYVEGILQHQLTQLCLALQTNEIQGNVRAMTDVIEGNVSSISDKMEGNIRSMADEIHCDLRSIADEMKGNMRSLAVEMERNVRSLADEIPNGAHRRMADSDVVENCSRPAPAEVGSRTSGGDHSGRRASTLPENRCQEFDFQDEDGRSFVRGGELNSALLSRTAESSDAMRSIHAEGGQELGMIWCPAVLTIFFSKLEYRYKKPVPCTVRT